MLGILKQTHSCSLYIGRSQKHIPRTIPYHGRTGVARPLSCFLRSSQNPPPHSVINVFQRGKEIYLQKSVDSYVIFLRSLWECWIIENSKLNEILYKKNLLNYCCKSICLNPVGLVLLSLLGMKSQGTLI